MEHYPQYAQLFGVGLIWVSFHCSGMCGPIIGGLTAGTAREEGSRGTRVSQAAAKVMAYQGGRLLTYAALGVLAGAVGAAVETVIADVSRIAGLLVAAIFMGVGIYQLVVGRTELSLGGSLAGKVLGKVLKFAGRRKGLGGMAIVGAGMGLLPCMTMYWVLSLAASTASPLHGAAIMSLLVAMTTPVLLIAGCAPLVASPKWRAMGKRLLPIGIVLSGVWLGLISAAANDWIGHQAVQFHVSGDLFMVMLW